MTIQVSPTAVVSDSSAVGSSGAAGAAVLGVQADAGVGVLAFTGSGPGTVILALAGLGSIIAGAGALLAGRRLAPRNTDTERLPDLSNRALVT